MKMENLLVRGLEICGGLFMFAVLVITCIVFSPYLVPKAILDFAKNPKNRVFMEGTSLFVFLVIIYMFLTIIAQ